MKRPLPLIAAILLAIFAVNICIGKYRLWTGTGTAAPLDGVPEFLLLLSAVALFVASAIAAESKQRRQGSSAKENHGM